MTGRSIAILCLFLLCRLCAAEDGPLEGKLVEITATFQEYDPFLPWQQNHPGQRRGYGIFVGDSLVITTENLVRNHRLVELRKARSGEKLAATVELADCQVDLALLRTRAKTDAGPAPDVEVVSALEKSAALEILQFDETSQLQRGKARPLSVSVAELPTAPYPSLIFSLLADLNINGEGAPVASEGKLAGLIVSYDPSTRIARMLPYPVLRRFLDDALHEPYEGVATAGVLWAPLIDPAKRAYLGVTVNGQGILATSCLPGTGAAETLRPSDVLMELDGHPIDNMGFYEDEDFGRLGFAYLIRGRRKPGETMPVKIVRDKAEMIVNVRLDRWNDANSLIPENVSGEQSEYLVDGGLIMHELTGRYLKAHGPDWQQSVDPRLVHMYLTQRDAAEQVGERVVILAGVLPDPINIGYQQFQNQVIERLNGKPVKSMKDVFRIVDTDGDLKRVSLKSIGVDIVLDRGELAEANKRIAEHYRIPSLRHERKQPDLSPQSSEATDIR